jgi:hypothetical protein
MTEEGEIKEDIEKVEDENENKKKRVDKQKRKEVN